MDSVFTTRVVDINLPKATDRLVIIPVGDIHYDSPGFDAGRFKQFLRHAKQEMKRSNVYYLFMGDELEVASTSERKIINSGGLHESTRYRLDHEAYLRARALLKEIEFMRGRILGMIQGNHYWLFSNTIDGTGITGGMTSTQWLAQRMGCPWLGYLSYVRLSLAVKGTPRSSLDIVACHGKAGGKLVGTSFNQVEELRAIFPGAHIYCMGHDHRLGGIPATSLYATRDSGSTGDGALVIKQRKQVLVRTGSFLRGYVVGAESYIVGKLLRPSELGITKIEVRLRRRVTNKKTNASASEIDLHVWS